MAIDLLNSFLQKGQKISSKQAEVSFKATTTAQNVPANLQIMRTIRSLQAGQTIQGEVVSAKGDEIQLAILKDVIIDARLAQNMNLTPGTTMPFQVKANTAQGLSLIPLFTNTAADPNAWKALDMAQIPANERSVEMVQTLMEKGMSIDKQTLQEVYREITAFKDAAVMDIVTLHQLRMPVTQENLNQLSLYQNNQHFLQDSFSQIGNCLGEQLEALTAEGKSGEALELVRQLQQLFQETEAEEADVWNRTTAAEKETPILEYSMAEGLPEGEKIVGEEGKKPILFTEEMLLNENAGKNAKTEPADREQKTAAMENDKVLTENMQKEQIDWKELENAVLRPKALGRISGILEKIWNKETVKQWMLQPEDVLDKENVKRFYDKLTGQIRQLEKVMEEGTLSKSPAAKAVQNTASNLDFMNQLNHIHTYIQLPLKMADQKAHGELYVFTNKKNLTKQEGKVTALLHLDMEYLGKMDVYVALEDRKVNTNFYLEKEEYLDFLEAHMDMLTARLQKRGYLCDVKTTLRNQEEPVIKTIEKQQGHPMLLSMQAFDVRA